MSGRYVIVLALLLVGALALLWHLEPASERPEPAPPEEAKRVFHSPLAGRWYDGDGTRLAAELGDYLEEAGVEPASDLRALILPHAGYRWSGAVAARGVGLIPRERFRRVVVMGPTHRLPLRDLASLPEATHYATPLGEVRIDREFVRALRRHPEFVSVPQAHDGEHSVQIEVPLLQRALGDFLLVPIVVGRLEPEVAARMAAILLGLLDDSTLVVVSSDFTHYGPRFDYRPYGRDYEEQLEALDMQALAAIRDRSEADFRRYLDATGATICGRDPICVLLAMLGPGMEVRLVRYDRSGRMADDNGNSVSYMSISFHGSWPEGGGSPAPPEPGPLSAADRERLLVLARGTIRHWLEHQAMPEPAELGVELTPAMRAPGAAFVTLKQRGGELRGCIGQIHALGPLYRSVMEKAVDAAVNDHRFRPVDAGELPDLRLSISALTEPRPVASHDEIVLGRHGIIIEKEGRRALFLPQVAPENDWDLEQTLTHLSRKAGLPPDAWREGMSFSVFEAEVFGEDEG